jgi:hypothetical protein
MLTALAATITVIDSQSGSPRDWFRMTSPPAAARTGLRLMNTPKNRAGTRRRASRSHVIGTAEQATPATAACARARTVTGWVASSQIPTGR